MKLIPVESIPKRLVKTHVTSLAPVIEDFVHGPHSVVKVDYSNDQYTSAETCVKSIRLAINRNNFPIKICQRGDDIYLMKI